MTKSTITIEPITHDLKIYPEFFSAVCTGVKRAELRKNDRDYRVGDTLHLMETPRGSCHQTGEFINVKITHIADVGEWMPGYVLLSVELQERRKVDSEPVAVTDDMAYAFHHALTDSMIGADDVEEIKTGLRAVFANLTAPVVSAKYPDRLPCSVLLEPGLRFGKGIKTSTMLAALARRAVYESDMAALSPEKRAEFQARIEDFKALIAQPAPVVPEEITIETATIIAYVLPTTNIGAIFKAGHDACRAARLQAQAQNAPQNIPEIIPGWIPVSERMPEDSGRYWCYVEEQNDLGKSHYQWNCSWNGDRWWVESENGGIVTHWMPLPAAPQEVKGE